QAKACAFAIAAALTGSEQSAPHLFNTCFTLLAPNDAVSDAINLKPAAGSIEITDIFGRKRRDAGPSCAPGRRLVRRIHPRRFRLTNARSAPLDRGTESDRKADAAPGGLRVRWPLKKLRRYGIRQSLQPQRIQDLKNARSGH